VYLLVAVERTVVVYLLDEIDALLEVHAEVDELPLDAFFAVLLLLEDEHVMVEELLQTLVGVVDAQLLERVILDTNTCQRSSTDATVLETDVVIALAIARWQV